MDHASKLHPAVAALITIVLIGVATGVVAANNRPASTGVTASGGSQTAPASRAAVHTAAEQTGTSGTGTTSYKDGQYNATGSYQTPGGTESIAVTLTLKANTIDTVDVTQQADSRESKEYQSAFAGAYKSRVVGKKINEISLSRVAGSSLTSAGFSDALDQIKHDAAA